MDRMVRVERAGLLRLLQRIAKGETYLALREADEVIGSAGEEWLDFRREFYAGLKEGQDQLTKLPVHYGRLEAAVAAELGRSYREDVGDADAVD